MRQPRAALIFARLASAFTFVTVLLGSVVCATRSGFDCHSWPGCTATSYGPNQIPEGLTANPALEMVHRTIAMTTGGVLIVAAILVFVQVRANKLARWLMVVALIAAGGSALFGRASVLDLGVTATGAATDLFCALTSMTCTLIVAVILGRGVSALRLKGAAGLAAAASLTLIVMHVTGQWAAGHRSFTRCMSWPILWLASDDNVTVQIIRTILALAALTLLIMAARSASVSGMNGLAWWICGLLALVLILAAVYRATGADGGALGICFSMASVALLWTAELTAARAGADAAARVIPRS